MLKISARKLSVWVRKRLGANWGVPFVLGFMVLLVVAAVCLAFGLEWLANEVAVYAFYSLVAGVVLQLVCFWRFGEN